MGDFNINNLLNNKSRKTETIKQEDNITYIDINKLEPSEENFYNTEDVEKLAMSIELLGGIQQNLIVKELENGRYKIIAGHRRRKAILHLIDKGNEEYRSVPCKIQKETDAILEKLKLILTNSTARVLTDWEKIEQAKQLKNALLELKEKIKEENKEKPKEERIKLGRTRDIVASMLNTSSSQVARYETIDNNLSTGLKEELQKGNINISTATEMAKLEEEEQKEAEKKIKEKGKMQIKDVKQLAINKEGEKVEKKEEGKRKKQEQIEEQKNTLENYKCEGQMEFPKEKIVIEHFATWKRKRNGKTLHEEVEKIVKEVMDNPYLDNKEDAKRNIAAAVSTWMMQETNIYRDEIERMIEK